LRKHVAAEVIRWTRTLRASGVTLD
jgi:hypothetical protein